MDNKKLGWILIGVGILLAVVVLGIKLQQDAVIKQVVDTTGSCYLTDGTCLHDEANAKMIYYIIGWFFASIVIALGFFLVFFERSQKEIISTLANTKKIQVEGEKFDILMKGLSEEEKKVMMAVKDQDGITQQTLRLRTDLHKSKLSIVLDGLEKKGLVSRKVRGKTKEVYLKVKV